MTKEQIFFVDTNTSPHAEPDCKYCIKMKLPSGGWRIIGHVADHVKNPKGVAEGIVEILNRERKLILPI